MSAPVELIELGEGDRDRFNAWVAGSPHPHFKQLYEWGEVVAYEGTHTVRLGVERNGQLCGAASLLVRKIPKTSLTFLCSPRGPVVDLKDAEALNCLLDGVRDVAGRYRSVFLRVDPDLVDDDADARARLHQAGFRHLADKKWSSLNDPRIVSWMDLRPSETDLIKRMRDTHQRHIRGAAKRGVVIREACDEREMEKFRTIMTEVGDRWGFVVRSPAYYELLWRHVIKPGHGTLLVAEKDGEIIAGFLTIAVGNRAWLLYTGLIHAARSLHPNEALWWEGLRWAKRKGAATFDFGGTGTDWPPQADSPAYSIYTFKSGFRAEGVFLTGYYDLVFKPVWYQGFRFAEERLVERARWIFDLLRGQSY
ncbi:MAG: lipid II:glycine glycyltransferase FemX [Nitrospirota bacterium]